VPAAVDARNTILQGQQQEANHYFSTGKQGYAVLMASNTRLLL
jgi:hypothetical protein